MGSRLAVLSCVLSLGAAACVSPFSGSNVQIDFSSPTQTPAASGATPQPNQPPADTYFSLYAVTLEQDANGIATQADLFEVQRFEIKPLIAHRFPLVEATQAHELLGKEGVTGKIVLVPNGSSLESGSGVTTRCS